MDSSLVPLSEISEDFFSGFFEVTDMRITQDYTRRGKDTNLYLTLIPAGSRFLSYTPPPMDEILTQLELLKKSAQSKYFWLKEERWNMPYYASSSYDRMEIYLHFQHKEEI